MGTVGASGAAGLGVDLAAGVGMTGAGVGGRGMVAIDSGLVPGKYHHNF